MSNTKRDTVVPIDFGERTIPRCPHCTVGLHEIIIVQNMRNDLTGYQQGDVKIALCPGCHKVLGVTIK